MQITCIMAAGTVTVSLTFQASKDGTQVTGSYSSGSLTMAGTELIGNTQSVGTSNEALVLGDLSTVGFVFCKNLSDANYVEIFLDNSNAQLVARLLPGEACLFKPNTSTLYGRANTAACSVFVAAAEL